MVHLPRLCWLARRGAVPELNRFIAGSPLPSEECEIEDQFASLLKEEPMERNEKTTQKIEAWTIILAVGVVVVVLGAVLLFFLMSS